MISTMTRSGMRRHSSSCGSRIKRPERVNRHTGRSRTSPSRNADQYREGEIKLLIIDSDSETLHLMARSGPQESSDDKHPAPRTSPLHRLNGIMLISSLVGARGGPWNVDFVLTRSPPEVWASAFCAPSRKSSSE